MSSTSSTSSTSKTQLQMIPAPPSETTLPFRPSPPVATSSRLCPHSRITASSYSIMLLRRYSTCWGWPELGAYHTCVGYWSGYYASRPSIKQVQTASPFEAFHYRFCVLMMKQASRAASALLHSAASAAVLAALADRASAASGSPSSMLSSPISAPSPSPLQPLREANGLAQHHDAITGTAKLPVLHDYLSQLSDASNAAAEDLARNLRVMIHAPSAENITASQLNPFTGWADVPHADDDDTAVLRPVIVYNSLLQQRNVLLVLRTSSSMFQPKSSSSSSSSSPAPTGSFTDSNGDSIPCEAIPCAATPACSAPDGFLLHAQIDVPALGFTTIFINSSGSCDILQPQNASWIECASFILVQHNLFSLTARRQISEHQLPRRRCQSSRRR